MLFAIQFLALSQHTDTIVTCKKTNTEPIQVRALICSENLDRDINQFARRVVEEGINLQKDFWFRCQVYWLRKLKPQIILRYESLETDLEIISGLVP